MHQVLHNDVDGANMREYLDVCTDNIGENDVTTSGFDRFDAGPQGHWYRGRSRARELDDLFARWASSDVSVNRVCPLGEAQAGSHPDGACGFPATGSHRNNHWIARVTRRGRAIASGYGGRRGGLPCCTVGGDVFGKRARRPAQFADRWKDSPRCRSERFCRSSSWPRWLLQASRIT